MAQMHSLRIRLELSGHDEPTSTKEFTSIIKLADILGRSAVEAEIAKFLDEIGVQTPDRYALLKATYGRANWPIEVENVEKGSWIFDALVRPEVVGIALTALLGPTIKRAYDGSQLQRAIYEFLRNRIFRGDAPRRALEDQAAKTPQVGNITIVNVVESRQGYDENRMLVIPLRRNRVLVPELDELPDNPESLVRYLTELKSRR